VSDTETFGLARRLTGLDVAAFHRGRVELLTAVVPGETMRKQWPLLLGWGLIALLVLGPSALWLLIPRDPISEGNCRGITPGMSLAQVEAILGRKADSVLTVGDVELGHLWIGVHGNSVLVAFDDQGRVVSRMFTPGGASRSFLAPPG
jgi:hypothetical protein